MSQSTELLPCPFCGDDAEKTSMEMYRPQTKDKWTRITCRCCGAQASLMNWNTRAIASVKREPLSDAQITELDLPGMMYIDIVRKIEQAHGIK